MMLGGRLSGCANHCSAGQRTDSALALADMRLWGPGDKIIDDGGKGKMIESNTQPIGVSNRLSTIKCTGCSAQQSQVPNEDLRNTVKKF